LKVNISYAVELDDVPKEIGNLLETCDFILRELQAGMDTASVENPSKFISEVEGMRQSLADLDLRMSDCIRIMAGYLDIKTKTAISSPEEVEENDET
tara:strand:- start:338 stop:628 length:291 start_codon:yes stop_codon:yes gene_type:complete